MGASRDISKIAVALLALSLVACSGSKVIPAKSTTGRPPTVADVPSADETVRGDEDPPVVTLPLGSALRERRLSVHEDIPSSIIVPTTNLNGVPIATALQAVLAGTDITLSWDTGNWDNRLVSVANLSGPLPRVIEKICSSAHLFCVYRNGLLELREKETFIIDLPQVPSKDGKAAASNSMAEAISELCGEKAKIDQQGGNLIYTADVNGQEKVHEYLEQLRNGRPLVVVQLHIWEVTLNKESAAGVNWKNFSLSKIGGNGESLLLTSTSAFTSLASPGVSLGATLAGKVNAANVFQFLSTQGQVQNISSPQLTFVSGGFAEFRVGGKQNYISQVGQLVTNNVSGTTNSNSSSSLGTNTVSTDTVDTGLTVQVGGSYEGGVVVADLEMTVQNLVRFDNVSTSGTQIQLPVTTDRKVSTMIRVRPGDNLVLAGMVSSKDNNNREGIPLPFGGRLPTYTDDALENTELVVLVKPSVVLFSDKAVHRQMPVTGTSMKPLPNAVMIDKDGAKTVNMPDASERTRAPAPMAYGAPSSVVRADETPVNGRLIQSGFSNVYDIMQTSTETSSRKEGGL